MANALDRVLHCLRHPIKGQAIADQLADNPLPDYEPMQTYFPDEAVMLATEEDPPTKGLPELLNRTSLTN